MVLFPCPLKRCTKLHTEDGYVAVPSSGIYPKYEHRLIAERALGKLLPKGAEVHHVNGIKCDNRPENLVVCPDNKYHMLLHQRQIIYEICGNANYKHCKFCKIWHHPSKTRCKQLAPIWAHLKRRQNNLANNKKKQKLQADYKSKKKRKTKHKLKQKRQLEQYNNYKTMRNIIKNWHGQ
jgi:HNH endonuclease